VLIVGAVLSGAAPAAHAETITSLSQVAGAHAGAVADLSQIAQSAAQQSNELIPALAAEHSQSLGKIIGTVAMGFSALGAGAMAIFGRDKNKDVIERT